jgi:hypothetical protein
MNNNNTHTPTPWILLEKANQRISQLCGTVNTLSNKLGLGDKVRAEDFIVRATLSDSEKSNDEGEKIVRAVNSYEEMREALQAVERLQNAIYNKETVTDCVESHLMALEGLVNRALALTQDDRKAVQK